MLQSAPNTLPRAIDYLDLNWPKDTEFVYSPFMVEAVISENTYSQVTFNQEDMYFIYMNMKMDCNNKR